MRVAVLGRSWVLRAASVPVVHVKDGLVEMESGRREKHKSLGPAVSCHPLRGMVPLLERTVTECLSKITLQLWLQSLPTPIRLCWKVGMILALQIGSWMRQISAWADD